MSYTLDLYFEPAVRRDRLMQYLATRKHFRASKDKLTYENPDTGVYFWIKLRCGWNLLLQRTVRSAEFEVNYNRPSFFGIEAERELSALIGAFQPRIDDPQMHGMGEGPYAREGFFSGWNFGNEFMVHHRLTRYPGEEIPSRPAEMLRAAWAWNDQRAELGRQKPDRGVPTIGFYRIEGHVSRVVVWGAGGPIVLPRVDHVLVGRLVAGEMRFGLATWSEILEIAKDARFDITKEPLELAYLVTPPAIAAWVASVPLIDLDALQRERLAPGQILDDELIAAARAFKQHIASDVEPG